MDDTELRTILAYHERTKHRLDGYARSSEHLDWATQPDPFRTYEGAPLERLPEQAPADEVSYDALLAERLRPAAPLARGTLGCWLYHALALSAWKATRAGDGWFLRVNPSSGNLHPTEAYLLVRPLEDLPGGIYHYSPYHHGLERRIDWCAPLAQLLASLPPQAFVAVLCSIPWRESWKYGERAFRYCMLDLGHALAALDLAAGQLGWRAALLPGLPLTTLARLATIDEHASGPEGELADIALVVGPGPDPPMAARLDAGALVAVTAQPRHGVPNRLSPDHVTWPVIDDVEAASREEPRALAPQVGTSSSTPTFSDRGRSASAVIRGRRSAVAMDGRTEMPASDFFHALAHTLPALATRPFALLGAPPQIALLLFVHRITGLRAGLYLLGRAPDHLSELRGLLRDDFEWRRVPGCPAPLDLMLLAEGDVRRVARLVSCHQEIASDGAFACAMLARFEGVLERSGAGAYRRLHWEAGMIGQVLYLEAEAAATRDRPLRGTGIGCFFDDVVHELLGRNDDAWQSLYHFTVGGRLEDARLTTLPAYAHLRSGR